MLQIKAITSEGKELDIVRGLFADYQQELDEDLCFQSFEAELQDPLKKYGPPTAHCFFLTGMERWPGVLLCRTWAKVIAK